MTQVGWTLSFNFLKNSDSKKRKSHFKRCFKKVQPLLVNGLRFASKQESLGMANVKGPKKECLRFKKQIEEMGIGQMIPNTQVPGF